MLPKIEPNRQIRVSLRYNEKKVKEGSAERIGAENFLKDYDRLTKEDILTRFRQRSSFNERLHDYGVHFSLNFGKQERLDNTKLVDIAGRYMNAMGFEDQPYVVYRHSDAGHTHLHIVATTVRADGSWIRLEPRHYRASYALSRELEQQFALEKNQRTAPAEQFRFAVDHAQKVKYGEPGLQRAISDVLNTVVDQYRYTSLDEFNAILKQYNVAANAGQENSRLHKVGGLLYHALDEEGKRIGAPIKASRFLIKPTLKHLEQNFSENKQLRESSRERLHTAIEWALAGRAPNWPQFTASLEKDGIAVVLNKNDDGKERIFFVDHVEKCAFAGERLGANHDLPALRNRCAVEEQVQQQLSPEQQQKLHV
ncbi:MAG TPA: relaxase/mobilization nuclease domain-containing protein [Puia sp.]|nr:relaxase/mobilization nuclease domain-containing protein [Puia sp.]